MRVRVRGEKGKSALITQLFVEPFNYLPSDKVSLREH